MRDFSFENKIYMNMLNRQVIFMDQAACYCPEYLATRALRHYPSRTAQIIRSAYLGEIPFTQYGADIVFSSILSGQGERWQNFGETRVDFLLINILGRELYIKNGFMKSEVNALKSAIKSNGGNIIKISDKAYKIWSDSICTNNSDVFLLIDSATFEYAQDSAAHLGDYLKQKSIFPNSEIAPIFLGFEYLAAGLIDEGIEQLKKFIDKMNSLNIKKIITLSGQANFMLTEIFKVLGITHDFEIIDILDLIDSFEGEKSYIYGGSFYTRFLNKSSRFNQLLQNNEEKNVLNSWEFVPLLEADKRVNQVGIWSAPICPEYFPMIKNENLLEKIYTNAIIEFKRAGFVELVICDPYALNTLKSNGFEMKKVNYFLSSMGMVKLC